MHASSIGKQEYQWELHGAKQEPKNGPRKDFDTAFASYLPV
jgi:hypothetical protein